MDRSKRWASPQCVVWVALLLVLQACEVAPRASSDAAPSGGVYRGPADELSGADFRAPATAEELFAAAATKAQAEPTLPEERKMIYTASLSVEVARPDEMAKRLLARVAELGGYLSQRINNKVVCRIPADRFDELVAEVRAYGRVLSDNQQASDVTKQHLDLSIRLENARKSRDRLLALLDKAEKVEDILKIEEQLSRLTTEIERLEGELKYLNDQVAMSTVSVTLVPVQVQPSKQRRPSMFPWLDRIGVENVLRRF